MFFRVLLSRVIGAFHGSLDWEGLGDRSLPLSSTKLADAGYKYIALGHYHRFSSKVVGNGLAVYPGAVEFKNFSDPGEAGNNQRCTGTKGAGAGNAAGPGSA